MNTYEKRCIVIPALAFIVLLAVGLACGDSAPESEPTISTATQAAEIVAAEPTEVGTLTTAVAEGDQSSPAVEATEPTEPAPTAKPEEELTYLGDVVEQEGYFLAATIVEDPATPGILYEPETGKKLIAVQVVVGNASSDPLSINPLNATLVDTEGFTYQVELGGRDGQLQLVDLSPGEKVRGWVAFQVPEEALASSVKYTTETFGGIVLKVGLKPPPEDHTAYTEPLLVPPPLPEARMGDLVENYGYSLSAVAVEDPATPGMLYEPRLGQKLVAVEIVVGNVSGEVLAVNPLNAYLVDGEGYIYTAELGGRDGQIELVDLAQGERVKGWVAFTIPEGAVPAAVKYALQAFGHNYLKTGL